MHSGQWLKFKNTVSHTDKLWYDWFVIKQVHFGGTIRKKFIQISWNYRMCSIFFLYLEWKKKIVLKFKFVDSFEKFCKLIASYPSWCISIQSCRSLCKSQWKRKKANRTTIPQYSIQNNFTELYLFFLMLYFYCCYVCLTTVWINTWNCEQSSRINIANLNAIIQLNLNASGCRNSNSLKSNVKQLLIECQYRLCHSKKLYCILLYYEPTYNRLFNYSIDSIPYKKSYENVIPIVVFRKERRQRSRSRRRRRHLNSFCDNFKII